MVKHVLIFCPRHAGARHELRDEQGHLSGFSKLLGTAERDLLTVQGGQGRALWPSHLHLPSTRLTWLRFEVLEATRNSTETYWQEEVFIPRRVLLSQTFK
jgi:hypothetical protein